ncbi:hypothetical protein ABIA38_002103 [Embleya sp. AB8]
MLTPFRNGLDVGVGVRELPGRGHRPPPQSALSPAPSPAPAGDDGLHRRAAAVRACPDVRAGIAELPDRWHHPAPSPTPDEWLDRRAVVRHAGPDVCSGIAEFPGRGHRPLPQTPPPSAAPDHRSGRRAALLPDCLDVRLDVAPGNAEFADRCRHPAPSSARSLSRASAPPAPSGGAFGFFTLVGVRAWWLGARRVHLPDRDHHPRSAPAGPASHDGFRRPAVVRTRVRGFLAAPESCLDVGARVAECPDRDHHPATLPRLGYVGSVSLVGHPASPFDPGRLAGFRRLVIGDRRRAPLHRRAVHRHRRTPDPRTVSLPRRSPEGPIALGPRRIDTRRAVVATTASGSARPAPVGPCRAVPEPRGGSPFGSRPRTLRDRFAHESVFRSGSGAGPPKTAR